jgi:uncharacterized protein with FMN-binding domain
VRPTRRVLGTGALLALSLTACTAAQTTNPATSPDTSAGSSTESASEAATENERTASPSPPAQAPESGARNDTAGSYRDGEYSATGWYGSEPSHHDVTLTITDDTVTDVEITTPAENETSLGYQQRFAEALPQAIVGRKVSELNVDRLAGSSGCSEGFMDALAQIRDQAAA